MAITALRPVALTQDGVAPGGGQRWVLAGSAPSKWEALSDDSNTTYIATVRDFTYPPEEDRYSFESFVLPAGSSIRSVRSAYRGTSVGAPDISSSTVRLGQLFTDDDHDVVRRDSISPNITSSPSFTKYNGAWHRLSPHNKIWTAEAINSLEQSVGTIDNNTEVQIAELYIEVEHFIPPVVTNNTPATVEVTSPTIEWDVSHDDVPDTEQFGRLGYEIEVVQGTTVLWSSGIVNSKSRSHKVGAHLANGTYDVRIRAKVDWGGIQDLWSEWDTKELTVDALTPAVPTLGVSPDNELGLIGLTIIRGDDPEGADAEEFIIERAESADGPWRALTGSPYDAEMGLVLYPSTETYPGHNTFPANGLEVLTVIDYTPIPKREMFYRVRAARADLSIVGPVSTIESTTVELERWILKNLFIEHMEYIHLDVEQNELDIESGEDKAGFNPIGKFGDERKTNKIVVKDSIRGDKFPLTMGFIGDESYDEFVAMRDSQRVLFLQAPMPRGAWFITFDSPVKYKIKNMNTPAYRQVQVDVIEVDSVPS